MVFHFADFAKPPGVGPGDGGFEGAVVAFFFTPLQEADVVGEGEPEIARGDAVFEDFAEMLRSSVEILGAGGLFRLGGTGRVYFFRFAIVFIRPEVILAPPWGRIRAGRTRISVRL